MASKLNPKQQKFVREYLLEPNATQAAIKAGYSAKTAYSQGQRLLKHVEIRKALDLKVAKAEITTERVLKEIACGAFFNPQTIWNPDGTLKEVVEMPEESARALAGFEVEEWYDEDGNKHVKRKVRHVPKDRFLDMAARHLGLYADGNLNISAGLQINIHLGGQ